DNLSLFDDDNPSLLFKDSNNSLLFEDNDNFNTSSSLLTENDNNPNIKWGFEYQIFYNDKDPNDS
ncbi:33729_t:CDS:2, partial [Racocetra persica]